MNKLNEAATEGTHEGAETFAEPQPLELSLENEYTLRAIKLLGRLGGKPTPQQLENMRYVFLEVDGKIEPCRYCTKCHEYKPFKEFHEVGEKNVTKYGIFQQCRTCYGKKRREQYREYNRKRRKKDVDVALAHEKAIGELKRDGYT